MSEHTLYFYNPGVGDNSWLDKDQQMSQYLHSTLQSGTWVLCYRSFGPPCGGFYYKLEFCGDASKVKRKLAEIGISESAIAPLHFE